MRNDDEILRSLVTGGFIDADLGTRLSEEDGDNDTIVIIEAAFVATLKANIEARKTKQPVLVAEEGKLYSILHNGEKLFIKDLPKPVRFSEKHFKLK